MSKLMDFLMSDGAGKEVQTTVNISGFPEPFIIRSITEAQNKEIRKSCQTTTFNKKTHQKEVETNNDLYNCRLIATCCLDPNFKDAELQAHHGVRGAESLIDVLLKPGQFLDLLMAIQDINGFSDDINEQKEAAKN